MRNKIWMLMLVFVVGGMCLIFQGARDFLHTRKLVAEGKRATATVVERQERKVYKSTKSYHVTVAFEVEGGGRVSNEIMVLPEIYAGAAKGRSISVIYYPKDPSICIVGNQVEVKYSRFVAGWIFLAAGVLVFVFMRRNPTFLEVKIMTEADRVEEARPIALEGARNVVRQMAPLVQPKHQFEKIDVKNFPHVDLQFYNSVRQLLEARGYVYLEDFEDVTMRQSANNPNTFIRAMLSREGDIMAGMFHIKPSLMLRAAGAQECKVVDFETQFSNGCFVCTSNAEDAGKLSQPAEVDNLAMALGTSPELVLAAHDQRIKRFVERTGAQPVRLQGIADVRKAQDELQRLKAEHRRRTGLSRKELERIGGVNKKDKAADLMFEEIMKEHNRVNGKASAPTR